MLKEFKEFAMKGNLIDLAIGFVMGAAFTKLTTAFIEGMVMPLVGLAQGKDLTQWKYVLKAAEGESTEVSIKYGTFLTVAIEFIIVAFVMFMVIKGINRLKKAQEAAPAAGPTADQTLLTEIRDLLKK